MPRGSLNVVIVGVGGQGVITAARILSEAARLAGQNVIVAETHGLSQRGGSVIVHVRIGNDVEAPLIPKGWSDLMIAMEAIEALRYLDYMDKDSYVIVDKQVIPPPSPGVGYIDLEDLIGGLKASELKIHVVNASKTAISHGEPRAANMYLLGFAAGLNAYRGLISIGHLKLAVYSVMKDKHVNLKVLEEGYNDALMATDKRHIHNRLTSE